MSTAAQRLRSVVDQVVPGVNDTPSRVFSKDPDDVVITCALRTPLTRAKRGGLKDTTLEQLVTMTLQALRERSRIDPSVVEDVCLGNVLHPAAAYVARAAVLASGFPVTTAASVASRWCSSGLLSTQMIANQIVAGSINCGIAIGAESMSLNPDGGAPNLEKSLLSSEQVKDSIMPMGWTSENVAGDFGISREAQDRFAATSQLKAEQAQREAWTEDEIFPVQATWIDPQTQERASITVARDDGIRPGTTVEALGKLKAAFPHWSPSTTTGGNASQISDGAAGLILMKRSMAERLGQPVLGKFVGATVTALAPRIMGIGPVYAILKLLEKVSLSKDQVDIFEINEAFSSMGVFCTEKLGIDPAKFNPRGGAVALGHPLGCTGARQIVTALSELRRRKQRVAVVSMCVGTGMAMAGCVVSEV